MFFAQQYRELYVQLDKARIVLQNKILEEEKERLRTIHIPGIPGASCETRGKIIKITVPDIPPIITRSDRFDSEIAQSWAGRMSYAFYEANVKLKFEKALCMIMIYDNNNSYWDVDNRAVRYIVNGLRNIRVIKDDRWENLSVLVMGGYAEKPRTEIFITDHEVIDQIFKSVAF